MNAIARSLLWKEFREHLWKVAALSAIFVAVPIVSSVRNPGNIFESVSVTFMLLVPLASMFMAMNIAAGEHSRRTIGFLQSLPTSMAKPAAAKLVVAVVAVVTPVLLTIGLAIVWSWMLDPGAVAEAQNIDKQVYRLSWRIESWYAARAVAGSLGAVSILLWMAAGGVNRSDEVRAGAVGLLAILVCWAGLAFSLLAIIGHRNEMPQWGKVLRAAAPAGVAAGDLDATVETVGPYASDWIAHFWPLVLVAAISHGALATWFVARFGRPAHRRGSVATEPPPATLAAWLGPPRARPLTAIFWKQARESAPLAALGAGIIILAAAAIALYAAWIEDGAATQAMMLASIAGWAGVGFFVSIVAGIGVFMDDLQPGLHAFWRSRPINVDQWFIVKFLTGLCITLITLAVPPLLAFGIALLSREQMPADGADELLMTVRTMLIAHFGVYCAAVLAIVLLRQAAYAAIVTLAAVGMFLPTLEWVAPEYFTNIAATASVIASVILAIVAWYALRKDWGWTH